jgi:hypothetical protein
MITRVSGVIRPAGLGDLRSPCRLCARQAADYALVKFEGRSGQIAVRGVVMHCCAGDTTEGPWATPTTGSGGSRSSRAGRTGTGVWQGRTADVSIRCTSWPIALPGRQGRSSRLAPGRDPGPPGYISGAPRRRCAGALPGRLPGRGSERLGCARGLAPLDDRHQGGELVTGRGRTQEDEVLQPECAGTPGIRSFDSAWATTDTGRTMEARVGHDCGSCCHR